MTLLEGIEVQRQGAHVAPLRGSDTSVKSAARALAVALRAMPPGQDVSREGTPCAPVAATVSAASLDFYAEAIDAIVRREVPDDWRPERDREAALRYGLLGSVLYEPFLLALRRMAHVARSRSLRGR